jgi:hypothetical protein
MVPESNGYGVREQRLWCQRVTVMVSESDGYGVTCLRATKVRNVPPQHTARPEHMTAPDGDGDGHGDRDCECCVCV